MQKAIKPQARKRGAGAKGAPGKKRGAPKIVPDAWVRQGYAVEPEVAQAFRDLAHLEERPVSMLVNDVLKAHAARNAGKLMALKKARR